MSGSRLSSPQLSRIRTLLFGALAVVWFSEMVFLGFQPFSKVWSYLWQVALPGTPQLEAAQSVAWALAAPVKGALCIMAVLGLRSRHPPTRAVLFASMALVPPLNILFPFRQQGFLIGPVAVATTLSVILWGTFFLFREHTPQPEQGHSPATGWEVLQYVWFAANTAVLTLEAFLLLFETSAALHLVLPCLPGVFDTNAAGASSVVHSGLAAGTHVLALAIASWIATARCRSDPALRRAMAVALTAHAALVCAFPLRQIIQQFGGRCAASSMLAPFVLLLAGWVIYAAISFRAAPTPSSLTRDP